MKRKLPLYAAIVLLIASLLWQRHVYQVAERRYSDLLEDLTRSNQGANAIAQELEAREIERKHLLSIIRFNDAQTEALAQRFALLSKEKGELAFKIGFYEAMTGVQIQVSSEPSQ